MKQFGFTLRLCAAVWLLTALPLFMSSCTEKEDGDNGSKKVAVLGVRVDPESVVCAPGDVVPVKVTVLPENATDRSYTWSTGDGMVAVVEEGNIRAIAAGTTLLPSRQPTADIPPRARLRLPNPRRAATRRLS